MLIELRERTPEHVVIFFRKTRDPYIQHYLPLKAQTEKEALDDFYVTNTPNAKSYGKTIYVDGQYVGDIWCYCMQEEAPQCMLSFCIFEKNFQNRGVMSIAVRSFCTEVHEKYGINSFGAFTYAENIASVRTLEKNAFQCKEAFTEEDKLSYYFEKTWSGKD